LTFDSQQPASAGGGASPTTAQLPRISSDPESPAQTRNPGFTLTTSMPGAPDISRLTTTLLLPARPQVAAPEPAIINLMSMIRLVAVDDAPILAELLTGNPFLVREAATDAVCLV
jgi:hypothetical protein